MPSFTLLSNTLFKPLIDIFTFRIYNANGMMVKSGFIFGDRKKINLDGFAAGLYFVEIKDEMGSFVKKVVVNR